MTAPTIRARRAGTLSDLISISGRALRAIPRDPEQFIPAMLVPLFFFVVNVGALQNIAERSGSVTDFKAFQLPVALSLMAKVGIITSAGLKKFRRYAVVLMTVVAAVLAPPDPGSMIMLAVPLMGLYEISIIAARFVEPKREPETEE